MPNTLAHVGVNGLTSRGLFSAADLKWVYLGLIIPDVPWILQRAVNTAEFLAHPVAVRAYVSIQASFAGCLLLCAALAVLTPRFWKFYLLLAGNSLVHLILDACQTKWANGVHFFAPFSWQLTNWGLFWPETTVTYVLTAGGLVYILWYWRDAVQTKPLPELPARGRVAASSCLLVIYFVIPFPFLDEPVRANNYSLESLRKPEERRGRYAECDRVTLKRTAGERRLQCIGTEPFALEGAGDIDVPATVSIRGTFASEDVLVVSDLHVHHDGLRSYASYLGLLMIAGLWVASSVEHTKFVSI